MIDYQTGLNSILRYGYRRPWWLKRDAQITWRTRIADHDAYVIRAEYIDGMGIDARYSFVEDYISGEELRAIGSDGGLVDLVMGKMRRLLSQLRPEKPTDEMIDLAMQAMQSNGAMLVLVDALLGDGVLPALPEAYWLPTEVAQATMTMMASAWAREHIKERWAVPSPSEDP